MDKTLSEVLPEEGSLPSRKLHSHPAAYALVHPSTGKVYVGSTGDMYRRINQHCTRLSARQHRNQDLQRAFDRDENLDYVYVKTETKEQAVDIEQRLLDSMHQSGTLFNRARDARRAGLGMSPSEDVREQLRRATQEQFRSEESRQLQSQRSKELWADPVYRDKHLGIACPEDKKQAISSSVKERWKDPAYRAKASIRKPKPFELDGVTYPTRKAAAAALGVSVSTIGFRLQRQNEASTKSPKE